MILQLLYSHVTGSFRTKTHFLGRHNITCDFLFILFRFWELLKVKQNCWH